jgi:hypothetical protein
MEHSTNRPSAATDFTQGAAWKPPNQLGWGGGGLRGGGGDPDSKAANGKAELSKADKAQ